MESVGNWNCDKACQAAEEGRKDYNTINPPVC
jgi:hypothetical protein